MSHYYDTSSRADEQLPSEFTSNEDVHSLTEPHEPRGYLIKAYSLMYGTGLAWIAALVAVVFTFGWVALLAFLGLAWASATAIGSNPETPSLPLLEAGIALTAATALTILAVLMTKALRRMINHGPRQSQA
ncbi:hypothetical protein [Leucobacter aridicollis]|uniref:hypothetical protein n=1 Tax=Leucobacter aridicollis TaxID=283878 RepID=UPI00216A26B5|nr:hypothetical protein [Leucobacter aridicollis]MCS3427618.1 hypothetical protein [Leucobacter aridicollis]